MMSQDSKTLPDIRRTVLIQTPIQKVWEQVSTSEGIAAWFMPNDFKAEAGHTFYLQSPFGPSPCQVTAVEKPHRISFHWDTDGWAVSFLLKEAGGQTEFTLIHGGWKASDSIVPKAGQKAEDIRRIMDQGWAGILEQLKKQLEQ